MFGDHRCQYTQGAQHCVLSTASVWTGAGQTCCCYDWDGWLMFSDDFEYNDQYLRFLLGWRSIQLILLVRFHTNVPPYVPTMSNFFNDLLPYEMCCKWAGHCEFYFWRRQTSTCQEYKPPTIDVFNWVADERRFSDSWPRLVALEKLAGAAALCKLIISRKRLLNDQRSSSTEPVPAHHVSTDGQGQ
ncbi:AMOP domain protein, partial [Ostertagia ostertagi]